MSVDIVWILLGGSYFFAYVVQNRMRATYRKWGQVRNSHNIPGASAARVVLDDNGLQRVTVEALDGQHNDHYDPGKHAVRLSQGNYHQPSVAALAVAAHESGHAIQHAAKYGPLAFRSAVAPLVQVSARIGVPLALGGLFLGAPIMLQLGLLSYAGALGFQLLTLPVEFDASRRAMQELDRLGLLVEPEREAVRSVLRAAAMTYVASAASSAAYIVYLALFVARFFTRGPRPPVPPLLP